jgi:hypothetical protein
MAAGERRRRSAFRCRGRRGTFQVLLRAATRLTRPGPRRGGHARRSSSSRLRVGGRRSPSPDGLGDRPSGGASPPPEAVTVRGVHPRSSASQRTAESANKASASA